jgi:6-phosphofructokinase 1
LSKNLVRPIDRSPGSFLHSSYADPRALLGQLVPDFLRQGKAETQDVTAHIQEVVQGLDYKALVVIGDDDMLQYAALLSQQGVPVVAIPKTIHNNIYGSDYTLGFSTGLARGVAFIHELRALAGSREQIVVVETFAAKSGYSTLLMGLLSGSDRVVIPEVPYDPERLAQLLLEDKRQTPANYAVALVTDGAGVQPDKMAQYARMIADEASATRLTPAFLNGEVAEHSQLVGSGMVAAVLLSHLTHEDVLHQELTYLLRTGAPDGQDLLGAVNFAFTAAQLVHQGVFGRMAAFAQNRMWTHVDLNLAVKGVKQVDIDAWYDPEQYQPKLNLIWSSEYL